MKLFVIGHSRHGKTFAAEYIRLRSGLTFADSSRFAASEVVMPYMKSLGIEYPDADSCWQDRHNHMDKWYSAISEYNEGDLTRLSRRIFAENDIYVGIRSRRELLASKSLSDLAIWIDAERRVSLQPSTSMSILRKDADVVIENNDNVSLFLQKLDRLLGAIGLLQDSSKVTVETVHGLRETVKVRKS